MNKINTLGKIINYVNHNQGKNTYNNYNEVTDL